MGTSRFAIGAICVAVAAGLAALGAWQLSASGPGPESSAGAIGPRPTSVPVVRTGVPRFGDCGAYRDGTVEPTTCDDPRANVEVGARRALGEPSAMCPLYDETTVLATSAGIGSLYICWVPIGGGPKRFGAPADVVEVTTTEPEYLVGVCGDVHDQHVHAPYGCDEPPADGVVLGAAAQASRCPEGTVLAVPASTGKVVCWGSRSA